ncbi:MAG: hypothetical protein V7749_14535 [Cocleimonas sp.]
MKKLLGLLIILVVVATLIKQNFLAPEDYSDLNTFSSSNAKELKSMLPIEVDAVHSSAATIVERSEHIIDEEIQQKFTPSTALQLYDSIYDEAAHGVHLSVLNNIYSQDNFSQLVELLEYNSSESIEFSGNMRQALQANMSNEAMGYVDKIGCYEALCIAKFTTFQQLTEESLDKLFSDTRMRNIVTGVKQGNGEITYQMTFSASDDIKVIVDLNSNLIID